MNTLDHSSRWTRRRLLRTVALGTAGVGLMAACEPIAPSSGGPTPAASQPSAGQPKQGGTLRVALGAEPANMDGHIVAPPQRDILWLFFDRLIELDDKGQPQPMLAIDWELSSDARQLKMNLRRGVQLHSGRELTSEDVKWSLDRTKDPTAGNGFLVNVMDNLRQVDAPDRTSVVLRFAQPWPAVFDSLELVNIIDSKSEPRIKPVGTGPFTFVEYVPGTRLRLARNKNYWRTGRPLLDSLEVQFFTDQQAMVVQLEARTIDIVDSPPNPDAVRLRNDPAFQVVVNPLTGNIVSVGANGKKPYLGDKRVRQALNYALDRDRIWRTAYNGFGELRVQMWPKASPNFDPTQAGAYAFDLDKVRALLAAAGTSNMETELTWRNNAPESAILAQIYQADLAKIGVKLNLLPLEPSAWNAYGQAGNSHLTVFVSNNTNLSISNAVPVANSMARNFTSQTWPDLSARVLAETDPTKQKALAKELNAFLLDESWFMPVVSLPPKVVARKGVNGIAFTMHETPTYDAMWLE